MAVGIEQSVESPKDRAFVLTGGKGAWAAVDPIGGDIAQKITQSLRDEGTLLVYSSMTGPTTNVGIPDLLYRGVKVGRTFPTCKEEGVCNLNARKVALVMQSMLPKLHDATTHGRRH